VVGVLGVGGLIGVTLGGILPYTIAKWVPLGLVVINTLYLYLFVRESLPISERSPFRWESPFRTLGALRKKALVQRVAVMSFLATIAQTGIQDTILFYLRAQHNFSPSQTATFLVLGMAAMVFTQWIVLPLMLQSMSHRSVLTVALSAACLAIGLYSAAWHTWHFYCIIVIASLGYLTFTVGAAVIANQTGAHDQGVLQGAFSGVNKLGMGLGPLIFNTLAGAAHKTFPLAPFILGCLIALSALFFALLLPPETKQPTDPDPESEGVDASPNQQKIHHSDSEKDIGSA